MRNLAGVNTVDVLSMLADIVRESMRKEQATGEKRSAILKQVCKWSVVIPQVDLVSSLYATSSALLSNGSFQDIFF